MDIMPNPKKPRPKCPVCEKEPARSYYRYCSNACQFKHQYKAYIEQWQNGKKTGLNSIGLVSPPIKRYLREKFGNRCCQCSWSEINLTTGLVPLVADHIDGNWKNNRESNLRLLCPNCDSLSSTYAGSNKGKGRPNRRPSKRAQEGRLFARRNDV